MTCGGVSAFHSQPNARIFTAKAITKATTNQHVLFYRNDSSIVEMETATTASARTVPNYIVKEEDQDGEEENSSSLSPSTSRLVRREVDRTNLHPIFKLEWISNLQGSGSSFINNGNNIDNTVLALALAVAILPLLPVLLPALPVLIAVRKARYDALRRASQAKHRAMFEQTTIDYRNEQWALVNQLLQAQQQKDKIDQTNLPSVIAVTMATGQEGQGVVRALACAPHFRHATILALVRNPASLAARALEQLSDKVCLVQCDSTDAKALQQALQPAQAVYLATTLNQAAAGHWNMPWNGGMYQIQQGQAFAEACAKLPNLRHVVYGTAPLRKWPRAFAVEPPIHYAAKWRVEEILQKAALSVTFLRKCPYHENFTKLTRAQQKKQQNQHSNNSSSKMAAAMGVQAGGAFDLERKIELEQGHYLIKAFTTPESNFTYNMMDPRDAGQWAVLAFTHPKILVGQSLSVASDALTGVEMAKAATDCGALGEGVTFSYAQQPRWLFESLAFVEPTFVYISGLQRWACDGGVYDLDAKGVEHVRKLVNGNTWCDHLQREGLGQFTETMADLLPDYTKQL